MNEEVKEIAQFFARIPAESVIYLNNAICLSIKNKGNYIVLVWSNKKVHDRIGRLPI